MRIAVAALGKKPDSEISEQAGRSPYYLIFDEQGALLEMLKNPFSRGGGGAGFGVTKMLADKRVEVAVAGMFGQKMVAALQERGLRACTSKGTVQEGLAVVNEQRRPAGRTRGNWSAGRQGSRILCRLRSSPQLLQASSRARFPWVWPARLPRG